jgi:hypothetical protein
MRIQLHIEIIAHSILVNEQTHRLNDKLREGFDE